MKTRSDNQPVPNIWPIDQFNALIMQNSPRPAPRGLARQVSPFLSPHRVINPRIRSLMQSYELSPGSRSVSVIGNMMGLSTESLNVPTPTHTDTSLFWDNMGFNTHPRISAAANGFPQDPNSQPPHSSCETLSQKSSNMVRHDETDSVDTQSSQHVYTPALHKSALTSLGDHLIQGNPLNSITPNSANQNVIEPHALHSPNGFLQNSQKALQGISSLSAKAPSPSSRGSVNAIHTLPVSALKDFKRNSSLSDSSTTYRRHHSETNTIITNEDKRNTDIMNDGTDTALQSGFHEITFPNQSFQQSKNSRTSRSSIGNYENGVKYLDKIQSKLAKIKSKITNLSHFSDSQLIEYRDYLDTLYLKLSNPTEINLIDFELTVNTFISTTLELGKEVKQEIKTRNLQFPPATSPRRKINSTNSTTMIEEPQTYATKEDLSRAVSNLDNLISDQSKSTQDKIHQDIIKCIAEAEKRIIQHTVNQVSSEYAHVHIKCIQEKGKLNKAILQMEKEMNLLIQSMSSISPQLDQLLPITKKINALEMFTASMDSDFDRFATSFNSMSSVIRGLSQQLQEMKMTTSKLSSQLSNSIGNKVPKPIPPRTVPSTHVQMESPMISLSAQSSSSSDEESSGDRQSRTPTPAPRRKLQPVPLKRGSAPANQGNSASDEQVKRLKRKIYACGGLITQITDLDLTEIQNRSQVIEISTYDLPTLLNLRDDFRLLEKKLEKFVISDESVLNYIENILSSVRLFERSLNQQKRKHHLHLSSEKNLLSGKIDLQPFSGSPEDDTIYAFLDTFLRFAEPSCSPRDQATLMYTTYLSESVRKEVASFKDDIEKIKDHLLSRYGDLRFVAESKLRSISQLRHPSSQESSKIAYYKQVAQTLLQVESMSISDLINQEEINGAIFNSTYVKTVLSNLPNEIIENFSKRIEIESSKSRPSGKRYFDILKEIIDLKWRQLDTSNNIRSLKEHNLPVKSTHISGNPSAGSNETPSQPGTGYNSAQPNPKQLVFPCPMHDKPVQHELGRCKQFLETDNTGRRDLCKLALACWTCLQPNCLKLSKKSCIASLPTGFTCSECEKNPGKLRRIPCILTCIKNHPRPKLNEAISLLQAYLKVIDRGLIEKLKPMFNIANMKPKIHKNSLSKKPPSKSTMDSKAKIPVYDTHTGLPASPSSLLTEPSEDCVYVFQLLNIGSKDALCFYDTGASGNLVKGEFAEASSFKTIDPENQRISGISNMSMWTNYGVYSCSLGPDNSGNFWELVFQGMESITSEFPVYNWQSVNKEYRNSKKPGSKELLPPHIGGTDSDILFGFKIPELVPKIITSLPSGIASFRCPFKDVHGSSIAYGGTHKIITAVNKSFSKFSVNQLTVMMAELVSAYQGSPWLSLDTESEILRPFSLPISSYQTEEIETTPLADENLDFASVITNNAIQERSLQLCTCPSIHRCQLQNESFGYNMFGKAKVSLDKLRQVMDQYEPIVDYRCENCEDCQKCKSSPTLKSSSVRDRVEQKLIEDSVRISYLDQKVFIKLPFTCDPIPFLRKHFHGKNSNIDQAKQVYFTQCKKPEIFKEQIRNAMNELINLDFIAPLDSAPPVLREILQVNEVHHYHIWRAVLKDSMSTPCRLVVDPSSTMLNLILAKGDQGLPDMFGILLRSRSLPLIFCADVKKLYNQMFLEPECIPYSLLLYHDSLQPNKEPQVFYMKRGWYGLRPTGNQAGVVFQQAGRDHILSHPIGAHILMNDSFVDDLNSGALTKEQLKQGITEVKEILNHIGMDTKYVASSGEAPPPEASKDGISMTTLGYKWKPESDVLHLNLPEVNFHKKVRGTKPSNQTPATTPSDIKNLCTSMSSMTRQHIAAKCGELFDPLGVAEPIKAFYKRSLSKLNALDWKDILSSTEKDFWVQKFMHWPDLAKVSFPRSTVPEDACIPLQPRLIVCSDSSQDCGGACVYLSFKLQTGIWSSSILTAKSRLMSMSVPRNELHALLIAAELAYAVVVSLPLPIQEVTILTDSLVSLCWVSNDRARNKVYVQNKVLTINRYQRWIKDRLGPSAVVDIAHIAGHHNPADILTKGDIAPCNIESNSTWQKGFPWMYKDKADMPLVYFEDVSLSKSEATDLLEEVIISSYEVPVDNQQTANMFFYTSECSSKGLSECILPPYPNGKIHAESDTNHHFPVTKLLPTSTYLVDVIHFGWAKSVRILEYCTTFALKLLHKTHLKTENHSVRKSLTLQCPLCLLTLASPEGQDVLHWKFVDPVSEISVPNSLTCSENSDRVINPDDIFQNSNEVGSHLRNHSHATNSPVHVTTQLDFVQPIVPGESLRQIQLCDYAIDKITNNYWNVIATKECKSALNAKELVHYKTDEQSGILFYKGRISNEQRISVHDLDMLNLEFLDNNMISFHSPCVMASSDIFYAFSMHVHHSLVPHGGVESTLLEICKRFHPIKARRVLSSIIKDCIRCKILKKVTLEEGMQNHNAARFTMAPPFSFAMLDLAEDFHTKSRFSGRQTMRTPALVIVCLLTGAIGIYAMEDWSTQSVLQGIQRHSSRYGIPSYLFVDPGSQLKALANVEFNFTDLHNQLFTMKCKLTVSSPKAHSSQGRVERKIGIIKDLLKKTGNANFLMSFLNWETCFALISNHLNNLPICRASARTVNSPEYTVITPNRLLLGRNNYRSISGPLLLDCTPTQILDRIQDAQITFYKLLSKQMHLLIPKPKWFTSDKLNVGDIALFFIDENLMKTRNQFWKYGLVTAISGQRITLEYTTQNSFTKKSIERSKRDIVRIASENELDFNSRSHKNRVNNLDKKH
jgi:hypothetical protein